MYSSYSVKLVYNRDLVKKSLQQVAARRVERSRSTTDSGTIRAIMKKTHKKSDCFARRPSMSSSTRHVRFALPESEPNMPFASSSVSVEINPIKMQIDVEQTKIQLQINNASLSSATASKNKPATAVLVSKKSTKNASNAVEASATTELTKKTTKAVEAAKSPVEPNIGKVKLVFLNTYFVTKNLLFDLMNLIKKCENCCELDPILIISNAQRFFAE